MDPIGSDNGSHSTDGPPDSMSVEHGSQRIEARSSRMTPSRASICNDPQQSGAHGWRPSSSHSQTQHTTHQLQACISVHVIYVRGRPITLCRDRFRLFAGLSMKSPRKPIVLLLGEVLHAQEEWRALSSLAELRVSVTPHHAACPIESSGG